ncbi:uncharacterized protein [Musca autumnalis]|uniref:uncharacterized protein n=1 Tax=Musca autumnalis TaxID=221902 RepID=UPI003CF2937C
MGVMEDFLVQCEEIASFEEQLRGADFKVYNEMSLEAEKQEVERLWEDWKTSYKNCLSDSDLQKKDKATLKNKKVEAHTNYIKCLTLIGDAKENLKTESSKSNPKINSLISVPPCDTEVFHGDYLNWPSFRDLFTAIYIKNKKLSSVEKLYHLFQKTSGEAKQIIQHIPLTDEGFDIAWENLKNQYENKRILINNQLRTIFNLPQCAHESASALKKLQRDINNAISILKLYKIDIGSWDPIFVFQCSSKLPKLTLSLWEQSIAKKTEMPSWEELNTFLTDRFHALESVSDIYGPQSSRSSLPQQQKFNNFERTKNYKVHHTKVSSQKCNLCKGNHILRSCPKFLSMDFTNRMSIVKRDNHCLNCLAQGHMVANCSSKNRCSKCNSNHHTLLHKPNMSQQGNNKSKESRQVSQSSQTTSLQSTDMPSTSENIRTYHTSVASKTMLATAWVTIVKNGMSHRVRALIDPCSDDSFVSERIQKLLKLPTMPIAANISGLGGECLARCNKVAVFTISSLIDPTFSIDIDALVVPDVTGNVPTHSFDQFNRKRLPKLKFADPDFYKSAPVDILIGGNLYPVILLGGVEHGILGSLVAQETVFGWIVTGPTNSRVPRTTTSVSHCTRVSIDKQLARFWEIEEIPTKPKVSEDDKICEQIYADTVKRNTDGRYMVDLPFKIDEPSKSVLNSNRYVALCQFLRNEQSMSKKPELKSMYDEVIQEYLSLGHMELVEPPTSNYEQCFYLPHHGVYKPESATTKLRVVFNGSCATATGKSLNDKLYVGPVLQKDIISLILNWRLYKYVFNADISKMYRQILVNPNQTTFQRIVYRTSPDEEIKDYKLNTVTFGLNCAPYLALRTLQQLAQDEEQRFPIGAKILKENMYVDDALVGIHTIPEGKVAKEQLTNILKSAGFHLRKWTSNCKELLDDLPRDHLLNEEFLNFDDNTMMYDDEYRCPICQTRHSLRLCRAFLAMHPEEKMKYVRQNKICRNCLGMSHALKDCRSNSACHRCWYDHHTLLHPVTSPKETWLQMTALALIHRPKIDEKKRVVRILLDPNATESTFYKSSLYVPFEIQEDEGLVEVQLTDRHSEVRTLTVKLNIKAGAPPEQTPRGRGLPEKVLKRYDLEDLADPSFYIQHDCVVVLGRDVSKSIYLGLPREEKGLPYMQNSIFGYTFFGRIEFDLEGNRAEVIWLMENDK